jgi:hypothetical protein
MTEDAESSRLEAYLRARRGLVSLEQTGTKAAARKVVNIGGKQRVALVVG